MTEGARLELRAIRKTYDAVPVLRDIDLTAAAGEVRALAGENGAGKSTLIKVLAGAVRPDQGQVLVDERQLALGSPLEARRAGVRVVYQEFSLVPHLSVTENVLLGQLPKGRGGLIDWATARRQVAGVYEDLGFDLPDLRAPVSRLSVSGRQMVEIAKALAERPSVLVLDEPSAVLTSSDLERVFAAVRRLRDEGGTVLYVSHRLDEVFDIADRITVLKDGRLVDTVTTGDVSVPDIIRLMVGRPIAELYPSRGDAAPSEALLTVRGLSRGRAFGGVDLDLHPGRIVGLFGLVGSGRSEVARAIFGADRPSAGQMTLAGRPYRPGSPGDALRAGVAMVSEDRARDGLVLPMSVRDNVSLASMGRMRRMGLISRSIQDRLVGQQVGDVQVRGARIGDAVLRLSGGNQQKVVLAKWLLRGARVLLLDEPTRGVDVGAKAEIYHTIGRLADAGAAVLLISSELPEILGMAGQVLVMREGHVVASFTRGEATEERCLAAAAGVSLEVAA